MSNFNLNPSLQGLKSRNGSLLTLFNKDTGQFWGLQKFEAAIVELLPFTNIEKVAQELSKFRNGNVDSTREEIETFLREGVKINLITYSNYPVKDICYLQSIVLLLKTAIYITRILNHKLRVRVLIFGAHLGFSIMPFHACVEAFMPCITQESTDNKSIDNILRQTDQLVKQATQSSLYSRCKERALVFCLLSREFGIKSQLVIGIDSYPFSAHAWAKVGTNVFTDDLENIEKFRPIYTYNPT